MKNKVTRFRLTPLRDMVITTVLLVCIWQVVVWLTGVQTFILPSPGHVAIALYTYAELIMQHTMVTALEVIIGLILGILAGILTALYLMTSDRARRLVMPALVLSQTIPVFALAPLLTLWLGYGLGSKICMTVLIIYFPVTSTFYDGLCTTPREYLDMARTMRSSDISTLIQIRVPAAIPALASGIKLAAVYAPIGAVIGEWVGASSGLGYLMLLANGRVKIDLMFAALIALCLLTVLLRTLIGMGCNRMIEWSGHSHQT